jgi:ATP adenylyltransferase
MKHIWAPWRIEYIRAEKDEGCIFCDKAAESDDLKNYILYRGSLCFVMLNAYPYNPGHLMVAPYRHVDKVEGLSDDELLQLFDLVRRSTRALNEAYNPQGFNIGINQGRVAGAGIEGHIHAHVVPRWNGDTNFVTTVANLRVMPDALSSTYGDLKGKII